MATRTLGTVLQHLRRSMLRQDGAGLADGELLECYITQRDEAAFEALVRRHGPMVLGVCRRVLGNAADAEDAFQATFLVLVRKAASIRPQAMVGNWLYGVAHNTALKARAMNVRRRAKEKEAGSRPRPEAPAQVWQQLQALLDQELQALPEKYRAPIVLCDLGGRTIREAARQLGWPPGTIGTRLARGRTMLARRLARHGLTLSGGLIATSLSESVASASVPVPLLASTVKAASLFAAGQAAPGVIGAQVAALTEGVLKAMLLTKLKAALTLLAVLAALAVAAGMALQGTSAQPPPGEKKAPAGKNDVSEVAWKAAGTLDGHESAVLSLAFGPGQVVVTGKEDGYVRVWDAATKMELPFYRPDAKPFAGAVTGITYAADDSWVSFRQKDAINLAFGNQYVKDGKPTDYGIGFGRAGLRPLSIACDGATYAFPGRGDAKTVRVVYWDIKNNGMERTVAECKGHEDEPVCAAFSSDGTLLVTGSVDKTARIWEPSSGNAIQTLRGHKEAVLVVAFSPDGKLVATGGKDGLVKLWDASTGKERASLKGHSVVRCLAFSPDGKALATGGEDRTLRVWDVDTGKERAALKDHTEAILAVGFSRDGSLLASAGQDKTIRLWKKQK